MTRWSYFFRRLLLSIPVILFGVTFTFIMLRMGPIDPAAAVLGPDADPAAIERVERNLGLDQPLWVQYQQFMIELFTFDFGQSWVHQPGRSTAALIIEAAPRTLWLGLWSVLIAVMVGIPLGFYAGLNPNTYGDYFASMGGIVWRAMPNFWLAIMLIALLRQSEAFTYGLFNWHTFLIEIDSLVGQPPLDFFTTAETMSIGILTLPFYFDPGTFAVAVKQILPAALVLGSASMGNELRIGRTAVLETKNSNYVETAKAKGVSDRVIVWKHIFRNALIPLVPIISNEAFLLIGGSVIVEVIFGINGLGWLFFEALVAGDLPVVGALMFVFILLVVSINILQDFLYTIIDPRVGFQQ